MCSKKIEAESSKKTVVISFITPLPSLRPSKQINGRKFLPFAYICCSPYTSNNDLEIYKNVLFSPSAPLTQF